MKKLIIILILLGIAFFLGKRFWWDPRHDNQDDGIVLYGNVDLRQVDLAFLINERIATVLVEEGDTVQTGQKLAELETVRLEQSRDEAVFSRDAARQAYEKAKNGPRKEDIGRAEAVVSSSAASLENAQAKKIRYGNLSTINAVSKQEAEDAVSTEKVQAAQLEVSRKELEVLLAGTRIEDIAQAEAQYRQAEAQVTIREQALKDAELISPCNGVVRNRLLNPGDMASPQKPVLNISLLDFKWVRAYLTEPQLGRVRQGDKARVYIDSFPNDPLEGTVGFISSVAEFTPKNVETPDLRTSLVYEVRIMTPDPENKLRLGSPATVKLVPITGDTPPRHE